MNKFSDYYTTRENNEVLKVLLSDKEFNNWFESVGHNLKEGELKRILIEGPWGRRIGQTLGGAWGALKGSIPAATGALAGAATDALLGGSGIVPGATIGAVTGGLGGANYTRQAIKQGVQSGGDLGDRATNWLGQKFGFGGKQASPNNLNSLSQAINQLSPEEKKQLLANIRN